MASTTFTAGTVVASTWLNDINDVVYDLLGNGTIIPASRAILRTNIGAGATGDALFLTATAAAARTVLGLGTIALQDSNNVTITGGSITGITDLAVADGGTGSSTAQGARSNLGLATTTTDNAVVRFDGAVGQTQNSAFIVDDTGHVTSFGGQITFPAVQVPSAGANTLDDYEEGTWTPSLTFGGGSTGLTYGSRSGEYTKIGNFVFVVGRFTLSAKGSSTGGAVVSGLPFTTQAVLSPGDVSYYDNMSAATSITIYANSSNTTLTLAIPGAAAVTTAQDTNFTNTSTVVFAVSYRVA